MIYTREVLNRQTGELETIGIGNWITIRELGDMYGLGRRQTTEVLRRMDVLQVETHERASRHRLARWFVEKGFGQRQHRKCDRFPFDVISPAGQKWIAGLWTLAIEELHEDRTAKPVTAARATLDVFAVERHPMTVQMEVCWLVDRFPDLTQDQIALVLSVSQPLVNRNLQTRQRQLTKARERRKCHLPKVEGVGWGTLLDDPPGQIAA